MATPVIDQPTQQGVVRTQSDVNVPASNTAAVLTYSAVAGKRHVLDGVTWSYSGAPTGGRITITSAGVTVFDVDVTAGGPGYLPFPRPLAGLVNAALVVTLAAGGSGVVGKINAVHRME